ncbi:hypothetical protein IWQ56_001096 [Coemansia nantahalensis]|uniref:Uncharacterized protein n=2 Tax=Coemansia TaxID=4863 RepID=A0ACC1LEY4_9FUNG|nr:hypothetical protein IWQ57_001959 [Coemansia nantahalensis]KAJ2773154.1 hypothetical protein IWQ56_001096 [Coemansia nantahalensis]KAJ2806666.1 hypothetical protein H4R21_000775 [Coemansia helicoidea]
MHAIPVIRRGCGALRRRAFGTGGAAQAYPYPLIRDTAAAAVALAPRGGVQAAIRFTAPGGGDAGSGIVGWTTDAQAPIRAQTFVENRAFWTAMVLPVLAEHAHADPELQALAAFQKTGWLNIADGRNPPSPGRTPAAEDILGCVLLEDRQIKRGSFQPNDIHRPATADGLFQLPQFLHARLVERLGR